MAQAARSTDDDEANRQTSSLAGLALVLGLVVGGLYLIEALRAAPPVAFLVMS